MLPWLTCMRSMRFIYNDRTCVWAAIQSSLDWIGAMAAVVAELSFALLARESARSLRADTLAAAHDAVVQEVAARAGRPQPRWAGSNVTQGGRGRAWVGRRGRGAWVGGGSTWGCLLTLPTEAIQGRPTRAPGIGHLAER